MLNDAYEKYILDKKHFFGIKTRKYGNLEILVYKMTRHNGVKVTKG